MNKTFATLLLFVLLCKNESISQVNSNPTFRNTRQRISLNEGWSFYKYDSAAIADNLVYDVRPEVTDTKENKVADAKPTEAVAVQAKNTVLKSWILPNANIFIKDKTKHYVRPQGDPGIDFQYVKSDFNDNFWKKIDLPHDWAISSPFMQGWDTEVGGGMGRLPVNGVAWYRKKIEIPASDSGKLIFLDIDGAMSYAMVWINGHLAGGWPYGYASFRVDLTPYIFPGKENQLAIRIDNPNYSSRWYPGAGIYRNVWLTKTAPVYVSQWGTYITAKNVSKASAIIDLAVTIDNNSKNDASVEVISQVFPLNSDLQIAGNSVTGYNPVSTHIKSGESVKVESSAIIKNPKLWGPPPTQEPNLYAVVTTVQMNGILVDKYETRFGIRSLEFNPDKGIFINGERIQIKGVNQHHDLGALGAAFNVRAAERQLEILREMGCNAIRTSHNPPAPELLELTDKMGFLVVDEIFDCWERKKNPHDFHLIFPEWSEPDARAFIRRDRNCPSVIIWSFGNEVGEQYTAAEGAAVAQRLQNIFKEEDLTRPTTFAMNFAKPDMELPKVPDIIGLNYQGEGIRQDTFFVGTERIRTAPQYSAYHNKFPGKVVLSLETASAFSSRGVYLFPVVPDNSSYIRDGRGGDSKIMHVSSYELYAVDFGSGVDKVFGSLEKHPFVAGEFVWTGWDHIGEPTPYYLARSSYCGIIDMAGFKKDRFYLYQSHWRPDYPMVHILPHWNWPDRKDEITPIHVFTSGDEAEVFLNGKSLGRKKKSQYEYRLRWDSVKYEPGEVKVITYKNGKKWAEDQVKTTDEPAQLITSADRIQIKDDGKDLSFISVRVADKNGLTVPVATNKISFSVEGPGEIIATDNGDPTNMVSLTSHEREAFSGLCLVIVRAKAGSNDAIKVIAKSPGLKSSIIELNRLVK